MLSRSSKHFYFELIYKVVGIHKKQDNRKLNYKIIALEFLLVKNIQY